MKNIRPLGVLLLALTLGLSAAVYAASWLKQQGAASTLQVIVAKRDLQMGTRLQPEMLESVQPDVHLVANLMALSHVIPAGTKDTARMVVRRVVDDLMKRLEDPMRSAVSGALDRLVQRVQMGDIDGLIPFNRAGEALVLKSP